MGGGFLQAVVTAASLITGQGWVAMIMRAVVSTLIMGAIAKATTKRPSANGASMQAQGRLETVRQPLSPRQVVYGRVRTGGTLTYFETTVDNQTSLMIITLTGHPVHAVRDIYYNDVSTRDYAESGAAGSATGKFAGYSTIYRSDGSEGASQPFQALVDRGLSWTSAHLQRDCAKVHTTHAFSNEVWSTGLPSVTAVIDGVADVRDPREGSPSHSGYSNNTALCIAHYIAAAYGLNADYDTEIDQATLIASANICDERVTLSGNRTATIVAVDTTNDWITLGADDPRFDYGDGLRFAPGSPGALPGGLTEGTTYYAIPLFEGDTGVGQRLRLATSHGNALKGIYVDLTSDATGTTTVTHYDEPRYRLNGAFGLNEKPQTVLERMLMTMAGKLVNAGGVWFIYAGAYTAPTLELDEDDFAGGISLQTNLSRRENANTVKGTFVDPSNRFQPVDFPPVTSATYLTEDGGERVPRDLDFTAFVTSGTQAQRLAKIDLIQSRLGLTFNARFKLSAYRMLTGSTVSVSNTQLGWTDKVFEVLNCTLIIEPDGRMEIEAILRETDSAVYDWSVSDEQLATIAPNTNLPDPDVVAAPTALTAAQSTTVWDTAELSCTAPSDSLVTKYQFEYRLIEPGSPQTGEWTVMPRVDDPYIEIPRLLARSYQFRVAAVNVFGAKSAYADIVELTMAEPIGNWSGSLTGSGMLKNIGTISTGNNPVGIGWSPKTNELYFGCDGEIRIHNAVTGAQIDVVDNGAGSPTFSITDMIYCPTNGYFYCSVFGKSTVYVFDPATRSIVTTIEIGIDVGRQGCFCPTNNSVYINTHTALAVIDCDTNTLTTTIAVVDGGTGGCCYCPANDRIYAASQDDDKVYVINPETNSALTTISVGGTPYALLYCPVDENVYCTIAVATNVGEVAVVDPRTNTLVTSIPLDSSSPTIEAAVIWATYCPESRLIYVSDTIRDYVVAISPVNATVMQSVDVNENATVILWVPTSKVMLVANNRTPGTVTRFSF